MNRKTTPQAVSTVRDQLLDHAQTFLMTRGYNGFSYRDLAERVGVKTSSIHYYFPAKEDLVLEAIRAYDAAIDEGVGGIGETLSPARKLAQYAQGFGRIAADGHRICLCGMLAADIETLPETVRRAVQEFFAKHEAWLADVLTQGVADGSLVLTSSPEATARALFAGFQGSVMASRLFRAPSRLEDVVASVCGRA
ncbi:TetR/AcrR family transcriptional regulator [Pandoraea nosoerga]|uniref:TetR family transcriptional regulator n=1 Tax=Pandoraea nosoerga TaxID=2508296 RepID=A0A5E4U5E2_9BURK|nr:TetR/AcrR family transcriptional regulator [Pandoraea nosoerga]MBN4667617.1 TetR/AcrR family transcriptional regulator [Pandoraea nosoerga]MBN4676736.1 TetR/AcrR family transcriptional regulator [Pandoraea nosoerga]MBN4683240.1 TetR/AcrR family transcriptional regulator [Pandoraea nosoerga]MBN4746728.1 TetR/AcrR family transcriptional regulator [Pandoraea nosoerga]VVD95255.1 TetR family transcriptional regulator [Pandoraea nosoerga]